MIEYNHSKGNERIPEEKFSMTEKYRKMSGFPSMKNPEIMLEYNHSKEHKQSQTNI